MKKTTIGIFEIILIVLSSFAFAHIVAETNELAEYLPVESKESKFISFIREKALNYLSKGIVSAQSSGMQTCLVDNNGASCQEYPASVCDSQCATSCFPGRRSEFSECRLGTCYDSSSGLCSSGSPKLSCESSGGQWSPEPPSQCNRGCCLIGPDGSGGAEQARLTSARECNSLSRTIGAPVQWDAQTTGEIQCLSKVRTNREGACVLDIDIETNRYNCRFASQTECSTIGGTFYEGKLCTNTALNTECEKTRDTKCFDGKDGVYFVDSCGNRANIYDSTKLENADYWNAVVPLSRSCNAAGSSGVISNQAQCGNCNYISGSTCGAIRQGIDRSPNYGQYVCRDLSCVKEDGTRVKHGQSWCEFDSRIGVDGVNGTNAERSVDVPGSRHYKKLCFDGEIRTEECAEYRNGLCVESEPREDGFTTASCKVNTGILCLGQNENADKLAKCEESPDCFLKHVEIDKFKFDMCVPKYPAGFELQDEPEEDSKLICAYATNTCTYYEKKGIDGAWRCKINCGCKDTQFVETMNNLCMSLGDCGGKVNLAGKFSKNYVVTGDRTPTASQEYINGLKKYATPVDGQRVDSLTEEELSVLFGLDPSAFKPEKMDSVLSYFGLGASGAIVYAGKSASWIAGSTTQTNAFASSANGAAVGAGVGYIVGMALGLEGDQLLTAVIIGAAAGAVAGYYGLLAYSTAFGPLGWVIAVVVAIIITIMTVTGVGEYREKKVTFECLPWQPPSGGGDCEKCGANGLGCTEYKCKSYGKSCGFLNKGTDHEVCVNLGPNDASAPEIEFNPSALSNGFSHESLASVSGVKIKKDSASDGCLQEYSPVTFGINLNEAGQCKFATERASSYEEMEEFLGGSNFYEKNHTATVAMPTLDELGISGINPERRGEHNLYIRCEDGNGHSNDREFVVNFCVAPNNDIQPPEIDKFVPESPGVVSLNGDSFNLQFYTNEPATCRFSLTDQGYETMENEAACLNGINQVSLYGWVCLAQMNVSQISTTGNYYFRCADQPWLGAELSGTTLTTNPQRNANTESQAYEIQRTTTALSIGSSALNGTTIYTSTATIPVTLEITTSGGIDSGKAFCSYSLNGGRIVEFLQTSLSTHKQVWTTMFAGNHNVDLTCRDGAGNTATGNVKFSVVLDNSGPIITRVYNSGSSLRVITNEASTCEYSTSTCSFEFGAGTALSGDSKVHTMPYTNGLTYRIKCRDGFGNAGTCLSVSGGY